MCMEHSWTMMYLCGGQKTICRRFTMLGQGINWGRQGKQQGPLHAEQFHLPYFAFLTGYFLLFQCVL